MTAETDSTTAAVTALMQNYMYRKSTSEDDVTLTAQEVVNAIYHQTGTPGTTTKTLPSAATLFAYIRGAEAGTSFDMIIYNGGDDELTLAADSGATITLYGTATVTAAKVRKFRFVFTSATAAACYCMAELA
jgi:hypothetical protein